MSTQVAGSNLNIAYTPQGPASVAGANLNVAYSPSEGATSPTVPAISVGLIRWKKA